ncbi:transporter substrate-binding domain-containing protein [Luteococcus peritonei]|uniref:Transporter substrate-binding domain-containing protein n=1 Tax=Luteococcus peritonei TaxID=88874 RepID=A0ABW4RW05_9ACTN
MTGTHRRPRQAVAALLGLLLLAGCGIPKDPDNTLQRIDQEGEILVGVAPAPPLVEVSNGMPSGPEAELAKGFARTRGATITWVVAGQEELVKQLEDGQIDLMVGGLTSKSPFKSKVGLTRAYATDVDDHGDTVKHVVAVPLGENAMVSALETWFDQGRP